MMLRLKIEFELLKFDKVAEHFLRIQVPSKGDLSVMGEGEGEVKVKSTMS